MGALTTTSLAASALASAAIVLSEGLWVEETNGQRNTENTNTWTDETITYTKVT